jgi:predicted TIM-barrel fold metal-dependent hydrolase
VRFDTGACAYLYAPEQLREAAHAYPGRIVFGSDHPVCSVERSLRWVRGAGLDPERM